MISAACTYDKSLSLVKMAWALSGAKHPTSDMRAREWRKSRAAGESYRTALLESMLSSLVSSSFNTRHAR